MQTGFKLRHESHQFEMWSFQDWSLLWIAFQWSHVAATMPGATYDDNITESTVTMEFAMCLHN